MCLEKNKDFDRIIINLTVFKAVSLWQNHKLSQVIHALVGINAWCDAAQYRQIIRPLYETLYHSNVKWLSKVKHMLTKYGTLPT